MKLPNIEQAEVAEAKITAYLLNLAHPIGRSKAAFFIALGFTPQTWSVLQRALLAHAAEHDVIEIVPLPEALHYVIDGGLICPDGRIPIVRAIWRIENGRVVPRFITAYPGA